MPTPDASAPTSTPTDALILVRLLLAGTKGAKAADLRKDLEPILGRRWPGSELASVIDRALIKLAADGLAVQQPGRTKRAPATFLATDDGRRDALAFLGVAELPAKPKPTWASLKKSLLIARALGLDALAPVAKDDALRAVLLDRQAGLGLGGAPTLKQAKEAWTRKHLGMGPREKVTLETVQAALFRRALAGAPTSPVPAKGTLDLFLAERLGAPGKPFKSLRDEIVRRWAEGIPGLVSEPPNGAEAEVATPSPALDLGAFARRVREAVRGCRTGRHGEDKVFVVHVWRALQHDPSFRGGDFALFKKRLAEANNARLLSLSRADLVQAMNPEDVLLSEVPYMNTCFHFVRDEPGRGAAS
ncbi:hypothetical protein [Planctomyces sp. SH-PL62]|uniref:hypothetical protein n=1 Tax=Planctomyces sp. SH-PL62 TaxID=1636152 RepID=UPI00078E50F5|nr:hypothetical protein [Planctomyces sp. SH-PL62]AMV35882.1 hypothetical protein VT85_00460 [Planctomyces sp. SH-PL62]